MKNRMKELEAFIDEHRSVLPEWFTMAKPSEKEVHELEGKLGITLPEEYRWFLNTLGAGGIHFEIYGYDQGDFTCLEPTITARNRIASMASEDVDPEVHPDRLLIVSYCEVCEWGIDTQTGDMVEISGDRVRPMHESFTGFLLSELEDSIREAYLKR